MFDRAAYTQWCATAPLEDIATRQQQLEALLDEVKETERFVRDALAKRINPTDAKGTYKQVLADGREVKVSQTYKYNVVGMPSGLSDVALNNLVDVKTVYTVKASAYESLTAQERYIVSGWLELKKDAVKLEVL